MKFWQNPEIKKLLLGGLVLSFGISLISFICFRPYWLFSLGLSLLWLAFMLFSHYLRYLRLAELNQKLDQILYLNASFPLADYQEGELSLLATNLEKIISKLKESRALLVKDKDFLADSLADISHQLRTPLTSLELLLDQLKSTTDPNQEKLILRKVQALIARISDLVQKLLKIAQLDAGRIIFQPQSYSLVDLVKTGTDSLEIALEIKEVELDLDLEGELVCDKFWTSEALANIIKNCLDYSPRGGKIFLKSRVNPLYTEIVIQDQGKGFSQEDLPHIFERFYKGEGGNPNSIGIGLALAKKILNLQNAEIHADNSDQGARFTIRFYHRII